jgi:nucleoside-diphosphate-sugar epimerase
MLFGFGTFRKLSGQLPILMGEALRAKQVWIVGDGVGVKQHIHVEDAAAVYELVLRRVLEGLDVPSGEEGIIFVENGSHSWNEAGEALAKAGKTLGALDTEQVKRLTLEEAAKTLGTDDINYVEVGIRMAAQVAQREYPGVY